jgi:DNA-binding transcriptional ArsR family regulator
LPREEQKNLRKRILEEMTTDYASKLARNFDFAKQLFRITDDGLVDVLVKEELTGLEQIQVYLIGKMYAKESQLANTDEVGYKEFKEQLGMPKGSLNPWLKQLRDKNKITQLKRERNVYFRMSPNLIDDTLNRIKKKLEK